MGDKAMSKSILYLMVANPPFLDKSRANLFTGKMEFVSTIDNQLNSVLVFLGLSCNLGPVTCEPPSEAADLAVIINMHLTEQEKMSGAAN